MTRGSPRPRRGLRVAGLTLAAGVLGAGVLGAGLASCALSIGGLQHHTSSYTIGSHVTTLVVSDQAGDVHITGGSSDTTSVTEHISFHGTAPTTMHRTATSTLTLSSHCPGAETCTVGYTITTPRTTTVRVTDGAGSVSVGSLGGLVTVHVNAGRISLSSLAGPVNATSNAGSIHGQSLSPTSASLHVSAGEIAVTFSEPASAITATTDVGAISVRVPNTVQYDVTTRTTVGSVHVSVARSAAATRTITASTKTGSITIEPAA
ncbi:MAG TPA: hypothetical protein VEV45_01190 [Streptosporangiaceae bacterium]|nr:hypothetical protein [Streptosporangiaceae bacterium]